MKTIAIISFVLLVRCGFAGDAPLPPADPAKPYFQRTDAWLFGRYRQVQPQVKPKDLQAIIKAKNMESLSAWGRKALPWGLMAAVLFFGCSVACRNPMIQLVANVLWPVGATAAVTGTSLMWLSERWVLLGACFAWGITICAGAAIVYRSREWSVSHLLQKKGK